MTNSKGPGFSSPLTPAQHTAPNYSTTSESGKIFYICSSFKASSERQQKYELLPSTKTLVHAPMGRMPPVYMSHHPTRFKRERKPSTGLQTHAFEQSKSSSRFDFHSTVCLHCAAGKTTRNKSEARHGIQMGMHGETRGIQ